MKRKYTYGWNKVSWLLYQVLVYTVPYFLIDCYFIADGWSPKTEAIKHFNIFITKTDWLFYLITDISSLAEKMSHDIK